MDLFAAIKKNLPETIRATKVFGKSQSNFMDNHLTVSQTTGTRMLRQILAEIERTMGGLREAYFSNKKQSVKLKMKKGN